MPFVNVSGDALSGQLAKGVTTDIATDFSRFRDVDAIANSVTSSLNRPDLDARKVAKDLKVQYVLTGAVQRDGDLVQVSAQVTDGETGASVGRTAGRVRPRAISWPCKRMSPTASPRRSAAATSSS